MNGKYKIDLATWKRKAHFNFFSAFGQPYFGVCTTINCTRAYRYCKAYAVSFFPFYLFHSLQAVNEVAEFKLRIEEGNVYQYEKISGSITVMRRDQSFGFVYFDHDPDFVRFRDQIKQLIKKERSAAGLELRPGTSDLIHYSVLPGIHFTSLQHAQSLNDHSGVPKIVFGKYEFVNGQVLLPLSVHVHHGLCDALHVEKFIKLFQSAMELSPLIG